jgi:hypothetical protein
VSRALTYVYCLVKSPGKPSLRGIPASMPGGGDVRVIEVPGQDLWLIVSSVPERDYGEAALQRGLENIDWVARRAIAHEAVVEHFLSAPAVLPMQLFALFTSDDRAVDHVVSDRRRLAPILSRIERRHEWGVRLTWDEGVARKAVEEKHQAGRGGKAGRAGGVSGASYLARKRDLLDVNRVQLKNARSAADRLFKTMAREASDARRRTETEQAAPGSRLLLDAAFLVPSKQAAAFRAALRRNAKALQASGLQVSLTGPWPPYNFI